MRRSRPSRKSANLARSMENFRKAEEFRQEMLKKIQSYNSFYEGKVGHQITTEKKDNGDFFVKGPLRIFWGVTRPIQLEQCDNIEPSPVSSWRHSLFPSRPQRPNKQRPITVIEGSEKTKRANGVRFAEDIAELTTPPASPKKTYGLDDSVIAASTEGVVRRKNIRKFNTVAYRGDAPNKWKRASINGHIYNYDTSVFTPVLGSCTSVSVSSAMNTAQVIRALMEKFKVVNQPDEYELSIVTENDEKLLADTDSPLVLRIQMGPDERKSKLFIKEKRHPAQVKPLAPTIPLPIAEAEEPPEEQLTQEVETLLVLPVAVLKGFLQKFVEDEEKDVQVVKIRYEQARRKIESRLAELKKTQSA